MYIYIYMCVYVQSCQNLSCFISPWCLAVGHTQATDFIVEDFLSPGDLLSNLYSTTAHEPLLGVDGSFPHVSAIKGCTDPSYWPLIWPTCEHPQTLETNNLTHRRHANPSFCRNSVLRAQLAMTTRFRSAQFIATSMMWGLEWGDVPREQGGSWVVGCVGGWRNLMHILEEMYVNQAESNSVVEIILADHVAT